MSQVELVRFADVAAVSWANGGGSTRVLADDSNAGGDWTYRVSVADLAGAQPFSRFAGVDRHLTFLGPGTLDVVRDGAASTLEPLDELRFRGEDAVSSEPSAPTARDLNVMIRRDARTASVVRSAGAELSAPTPGETTIWVALDASGRLDGEPLAPLDLVRLTSRRAGGPAELPVRVEGLGVLIRLRAAPGGLD